jgi:hypothetical protein
MSPINVRVLVPAATAVQCDARDDYGRHQHYGNSRRHDAARCDTPNARQEKIYSSGNLPNCGVRRPSFMGWAQLGQRGGVGAELLVHSSLINENSVLEPPPMWRGFRIAKATNSAVFNGAASRRPINGGDGLTVK